MYKIHIDKKVLIKAEQLYKSIDKILHKTK